MSSKIAELIFDGLGRKNERICKLFYYDPVFHKIYHILRDTDNDSPEAILDILITVCETNRDSMNKLIEYVKNH